MPFQLDATDRSFDPENELTQNVKLFPSVSKYQNTYRLEPLKPFKIDAVDKIVKLVMTNNLEDVNYDPEECPKLCSTIAKEIRKRIKKLNFNRHKIVVIVTIIENSSQSLEISIGYLWDYQRDNYSTFTYETQTFHAYCCIFGIYYD